MHFEVNRKLVHDTRPAPHRIEQAPLASVPAGLPHLLLAAMLAIVALAPGPASAQASDFDALTAGAAQARARGDIQQAIQLYTQALALNPKSPEAWWFLGTLQYGADQYAQAADSLTHFIALTPNAGPATALRGLCEFEVGQYPESLQDLQRGIALGAASQPRNAQILLYHEALALARLGRYEEAIGKYTLFVQHGQIGPDLATAIGLAGLRMPMLPKDADPAQAELISAVGQAAITVMSGDASGGHQAFQSVFDHYPSAPMVHYFYGYLLFPTDAEQAAVQFRQETSVTPSGAIAPAMLSWIAELENDFVAALPDARKAAALDPTLPIGQLVLGRALVETGDLEAGLPHLASVLQMEPSNLEAHLTLAKAYSKLGRKQDASKERQLCLTLSDQGTAPSATP